MTGDDRTVERIYVELLNEGTQVWRPVAASPHEEGIYEIVEPAVPDEEWRYPSGSVVRVQPRDLDDGPPVLVAVELLEAPPPGSPAIDYAAVLRRSREERTQELYERIRGVFGREDPEDPAS